jgi:hypothetical protein
MADSFAKLSPLPLAPCAKCALLPIRYPLSASLLALLIPPLLIELALPILHALALLCVVPGAHFGSDIAQGSLDAHATFFVLGL